MRAPALRVGTVTLACVCLQETVKNHKLMFAASHSRITEAEVQGEGARERA